jgi:HD-like signal output (HDOD) protein
MNNSLPAQNIESSFVQSLAEKLSQGSVELPSFPDVVIRLRQVLADNDSTTAQISQLLGAEPALAAQLLKLANSAAFRPGTTPISDLNMVINRVGRSMVRNAAMSYGVQKVRDSQQHPDAQQYLSDIWSESTLIAALSYVVAKKLTKLNPDEALLLGLLHGIGKLYIVAQAEAAPEIFGDSSKLRNILHDQHAALGAAIIKHWMISEEVAYSIENYQNISREHDGPTDLTDVLTIANLLSGFLNEESDSEIQLSEIPASQHLTVSAGDIMTVLMESEEQVASLRRALES